MVDEVISLRIGKELKSRMQKHEHINWSAVARRVLAEEVDKMNKIDSEKAMNALKDTRKILASKVFEGGRTGAEIIREWRDKRK